MGTFSGTLNSNDIFAALYNMIISQQVFADNIAGTKSTLVDMARIDGTLYGDTKLFYSTDVLKSSAWGNDAEAANLLKLYRPEAPEVQAITLDTFRQICLTVDNYLSKQAFSTEGAFSSFNSVMLGWIRDTKRVYDATTYNAYVGTAVSPVATENISINLKSAAQGDPLYGVAGEEKNRMEAQIIGEEIAKLLVNLEDISRDFNDYGNLRSYNASDLLFIWNSDAMAKIEKRDLPTIFHKEIIDKFGQHTLPARYFGTINTGTKAGDGKTIRSLVEQEIGSNHYFAGDLIKSGDTAPAGTSYTVDKDVLFKVIHKNSIPYMSAFEVGTSFFNPKALTETNYLTFGHNTLEYLKNYPMITVKQIV